MRYENKTWYRSDNHFYTEQHSFKLDDVRVLHAGVDTVKELFTCLIKQDILQNIQYCYEESFDSMYSVGEYHFLISKSSSKSGYQWILRNADLGVVVLLKSFYCDSDLHGSHIKIEGSPHLINSLSPAEYSAFTLKIACLFATQVAAKGCAVHLAVDLKGWKPEKDFEYNLVTRSKRKMSFSGIAKAEFDLAEIAAIYGDRETYTFGSASSVQLCVYDKIKEATKTDKLDYWEQLWETIPSVHDPLLPEYNRQNRIDYETGEVLQGDDVTRLEFRFHHSVIQQFAVGTDFTASNFEELSPHLNGLFQYGLNNFRYHYSSSYVHPVWQLLAEDVHFFDGAFNFMYKRSYKSAEGVNVRRKIAIWLGNTIRLHARKNIKAKHIVNHVLNSGLNDELCHYFGLFINGFENTKELLFPILTDHVEFKRQQLILQGIAA